MYHNVFKGDFVLRTRARISAEGLAPSTLSEIRYCCRKFSFAHKFVYLHAAELERRMHIHGVIYPTTNGKKSHPRRGKIDALLLRNTSVQMKINRIYVKNAKRRVSYIHKFVPNQLEGRLTLEISKRQ
jgi:hypothetical protein